VQGPARFGGLFFRALVFFAAGETPIRFVVSYITEAGRNPPPEKGKRR
jgi:hypothetical protein